MKGPRMSRTLHQEDVNTSQFRSIFFCAMHGFFAANLGPDEWNGTCETIFVRFLHADDILGPNHEFTHCHR